MLIQKKLYTIDEYRAFQDLPEHADRLFELIDGEVVEKMASFKPSRIAVRISRYFDIYVDESGLGYVTAPDGAYEIAEDSVFMPDVGYISKARLPEEPDREAPIPPDIAVEVKSPTDSKRKMRRKAERYLDAGTKIVWLVFPDDQQVEVYTLGEDDVRVVGIDGTLDCGDVLPGFTLLVKDIFR